MDENIMKPTTRQIQEGTAAVKLLKGKPGSGISGPKPAPPKPAPKPESKRQTASRSKPLKELDAAASAIGLPLSRNRRPKNAKAVRRHVEALGLTTAPSIVFESIADGVLLGLRQKAGASVRFGSLWGCLVEYATRLNRVLGHTYRTEADAYRRRLRDMLRGWCLGWKMHHPQAVAVQLVEFGVKPSWTAITNEGVTITGVEAEHMPEPALISPGGFWKGTRIPDDGGDAVVDAEFLGLSPDVEKVVESMLDPEIRRWLLGGERPKTWREH